MNKDFQDFRKANQKWPAMEIAFFSAHHVVEYLLIISRISPFWHEIRRMSTVITGTEKHLTKSGGLADGLYWRFIHFIPVLDSDVFLKIKISRPKTGGHDGDQGRRFQHLWVESIGVGAHPQSSLGEQDIFVRKYMHEKLQNARILHDICPKN